MAFRSFLQSLLQDAARQKVQRTVAAAVQQQVRQAAGQTPPEPPGACQVGVVFALREESGGLEDLLEGATTIRAEGFLVRQGTLHGRRVAIALSGASTDRAAEVTDALVRGHQPRWVISAGFAGGLDPKLRRNDLLVADRLLMPDPANPSATLELPVEIPLDQAALASTPGVHLGPLLTVPRVVRLAEEKRVLGQQYGAAAVDMETFGVAAACRVLQVPLLAVRAITDAADEALPPDIEHLTRQRSTAGRFGAAVGAIFRRPASVKDLWQLKETALVASDRLAKFLATLIEQLGGTP